MTSCGRGAALAAALLLAGCNSMGDSLWGQYFQIARQSVGAKNQLCRANRSILVIILPDCVNNLVY